MPEALEGSQPGITIDEVINICADEFGHKVANTRFSNRVRRAFNRALLDIWNEHKYVRRFKVVGADVTLRAGVSDYDVRQTVEDGGWGWAECEEIITCDFGGDAPRRLERIDLEDWRYRQLNYASAGPPEGIVIIDPYRVKVFPAPDRDYVANGDYYQGVPYITSGRVDWPKGWDQVALLGAEYYIARTDRPALMGTFKKDYEDALPSIKKNDRGVHKPQRAKVTRRYAKRAGLPGDNSMDLRGPYA